MSTRKPHFFNVSHCFDTMFELSQLSCMAAVGSDIMAFAARYLMAPDTFLVIVFCQAVPCNGLEMTSLWQWEPILQWWRKYLPTRDAHQETKCDGSTWYYYPLEWMAANEGYNAKTLIWRNRSNTDHTRSQHWLRMLAWKPCSVPNPSCHL